MGNDTRHKWCGKENWSGYTNVKKKRTLRQNLLLETKIFYNDKRTDPSKRSNNYKHICTYQQSPKIHGAKTDRIKRK